MSTWSHTRIETFRQCARKYFYQYVARVKLPREPEGIEAFLGSCAHDALEHLYLEVRRGRVPGEDQLLAWFREAWDAGWNDDIVSPADGRAPLEQRAEAEGWLALYHRQHAPFAGGRIVSLEQRITFPLDDEGAVRMQGFVDRLEIAPDGTWRIHDYKTSRRLPTQQDKDADPQLAYYEIGVRRMWPTAERVELVWHFLKFGVSITSHRTPDQLEALRGEALATIADALSRAKDEAAFPIHESRLCDWCAFQQICPARKHLFTVAELTPARFAKEPGVRLVDAWTVRESKRHELQAALDEIENEIAEIKQALAAFAAREGVEVVAGSEREATVRAGESVVFPRKTVESDEAAALEAQLRASRWWNEASALDRAALKRLWDRRAALDADLRALLEEFARIETQVDVRLRKPRG